MPALYATDNVLWPKKTIYEHFFLGGSDWYAAEYCPDQRLFFGFSLLNQDYENSEWGCFSLDELASVKLQGIEVDRDLYWEPKEAGTIDKIVAGMSGGKAQ
jgi:hypothetical protein